MQTIFNIINIPLGWVLEFLAGIFGGNFAASVFVFTLLANLAFIPLSIKSQKSSVQQTRIKPKLDELKKRYGDDKQKYSEAMQQLYQEENVSMSGGCLPMIVRLVIMMSIYWLIMSPLTYMANVDKKDITSVHTAIVETMNDYEKNDKARYDEFTQKLNWTSRSTTNADLTITSIIRNDPAVIAEVLPEEKYAEIEKSLERIIEKDKEVNINFYLFGNKNLDLTQTPKFSFDIFHNWQTLWLIPIGAFLAQILTSLISMKINKINNPDAPSMAGMMLTMPLISLFIGFGLPGGVGFYWICSSLIGGLIQSGVQLWYGPQKLLARERSKELLKQCDFEAKQIEKFNDTDSIIKE